MNLCSKCHKDFILKFAAKGNSSNIGDEPVVAADLQGSSAKTLVSSRLASFNLTTNMCGDTIMKAGPTRCSTCKKRIGLTGYNCHCGNIFCSIHRYLDKHGCTYDYQAAARDAIAKANPIVKSKKLDKI
ncbi:hypothetical protein P3X46_013107 [Hevea brasiliensis]|uniref:AN1-type domain-containing protein n=1 Tax=Hevea brasiliensis TaxID=3981 RepID=A0ABQ9M2G5_HEVBR|nr:hypothetical protein P3X46_013107 [Hevea brasiliensis]